MTCSFCSRAVSNPELGQHFSGCRGCRVRLASMAPRAARETMVEAEPDSAAFQRDVVDEFNRRMTWRRSFAGERE